MLLESVSAMLPRVLVCLCVCWSIGAAQQRLDLYEGDICKQTQLGLWTCKPIRDCPKAIDALRNGKKLQQCNFAGSQPVVCCEPSQRPTEIGAKSKQMCEKYGESVYINVPDFLGNGITRLDTCAVVEPLITNGKNSESREYPHMALIGYGNKDEISWLCGGSLISERYILSAAHCSQSSKGVPKWARLGDFNVKSTMDDSAGLAQSEEYEIIERINHPQYRSPSVYNDIALYKLGKTVQFNEYIRPICLQTEHQFPNTYAIATGWGRTEWGGKGSDILQKANLTITPRRQCSDAYRGAVGEKLSNGIRDASQMCAGDIENGKDTCQGDSGGPLQIRMKKPYCMYSQIGITSFGAKCGGNKPGVYTRVSNFIPWIESIVWP
uniref:Peptidase S1 domain-containing protein n=1 Tax=Graphocephala atropunctata TaxID=36148 RepID=A0A1B6LJF7_9HEMI